MSNNLNLPQLTGDQLQKEVTINAQAGILDSALTEVYEFPADTPTTPTITEVRENMVFRQQAGNTAANTLTMTANKKLFIADNTLSTFELDVVTGATTVTVPAGSAYLCYMDGTTDGLVKYTPDITAAESILSFFAQGQYTNSEVIGIFAMTNNFQLPISLAGSYGYAVTAPTGSISIDIRINGGSVGSVDFAAASNTATFTFASAQLLAPGDILTFVAPIAADATLADVSVSIRANIL